MHVSCSRSNSLPVDAISVAKQLALVKAYIIFLYYSQAAPVLALACGGLFLNGRGFLKSTCSI